MSVSYWKRQYEAVTELNLQLRDQILALEAELVSLRLERTQLLNLIALLSRDLPHAQATDPSPSPKPPSPSGR